MPLNERIFDERKDFDPAIDAEVLANIGSLIRPAPLELPSEWCQKHRKLSAAASANPTRYNLSVTPYIKEIIDCGFPGSPIRKVVLMKASQTGFSEMNVSLLMYLMVHYPTAIQYVMYKEKPAKDFSNERIKKMIQDNPIVQEVMTDEDTDTILNKSFRNGHLKITGATNAGMLKASIANYVFADEADEWPLNVDGQGCPLQLVMARMRTFGKRGKIFIGSSPTFRGTSRIEKEFEQTDKRYFFVPCPHCGEKQVLDFKRLRKETRQYHCVKCEKGIDEHYKPTMFNAGEWIPTASEKEIAYCEEHGVRGYHISAMYAASRWLTWGEILKEHEAAKGDIEKSISFKNTFLGETWAETTSIPSWKEVAEKCEDYMERDGKVPKQCVRLTAGVDVQGDRLEVSVYGWSVGFESFLIDHEIFKETLGDSDVPDQNATLREGVWDLLDEYLHKKWNWGDVEGCKIGISCAFIDSKFRKEMVEYFTRRPSVVDFAYPSFGSVAGQVGARVKPSKVGSKSMAINPNAYKMQLYGSLKLPPPSDEDRLSAKPYKMYRHYPVWLKENVEFFRQLVSERPVIANKSGRVVWEKLRARNETLDTFVAAAAAAEWIGMNRITHERFLQMQTDLSNPVREGRVVTTNGRKRKRTEPYLPEGL